MLENKVVNIALLIQANDGTPALIPNSGPAGDPSSELFVEKFDRFLNGQLDEYEGVYDVFTGGETLLVLCRSGGRANTAAVGLGAEGFTTYNIEGGFEGVTNDETYPGPDTLYRDVNGWRNAKLPYSYSTAGGYYLNNPEE